MAEYINKEKMLKDLDETHTDNEWLVGQYNADWIYSFIESQPNADVVEVKHGEWILHKDGSGTCKECGRHQKYIWDMCSWQKYCGHCGAKMDGKEDA